MNKFLTFLATGFIAILGVFSVSGSTKNAAEPHYFLENKEIHNAIVMNSNNTATFYLDNIQPADFDLTLFDTKNHNVYNEQTKFYYYNENNTKVEFTQERTNEPKNNFEFLANKVDFIFENAYTSIFSFSANCGVFKVTYNDPEEEVELENNKWFYLNLDTGNFSYVKAIVIENYVNTNEFNFTEFLELIQNNENSINRYIGYRTSLTDVEQTNSLDQIGNIISDTIDWFVNIFSGLSNVFYNNGSLSVWGNVLFIGVAIYLVSMCLVWVISLIKGV